MMLMIFVWDFDDFGQDLNDFADWGQFVFDSFDVGQDFGDFTWDFNDFTYSG